MARRFYFVPSVGGLLLVGLLSLLYPVALWLLVIVVPWIVIGIHDIYFSRHNVLTNYPVLGHLRYAMEFISPEIRQYFIESNENGKPYNRIQRHLIKARAEGLEATQPFGTQLDIMEVGYKRANHSLAPKVVDHEEGRVEVGGPDCGKPYKASRLNISAMSFGALSPNAVHALNAGAKLGGFAQNTGEGGLSPYHLAGGGDIIWQIGTGYFGCRTPEGRFDRDGFAENASRDVVKMIEIKLSQGAKPAHGGVLPGAKVNAEIARIRGVPVGKDVISPPAHSEFSTPAGLLEFVQDLRKITGGKPVGFKLCIGNRNEFMGICKAMLETGILPDFITVDGAEGGTGAAPLEFTDRLGVPIDEGLAFVHNCLVGIDKRDRIRIIASGKVISGFDIVQKLALGADMCNMARPMMFAVGCIQAVRCNTNDCPTGVATQDRTRAQAVNVDLRQHHVTRFHGATMASFLDLVGALGLTSPDQLGPEHIYRRTGNETELPFDQIYPFLNSGDLLGDDVPTAYRQDWDRASATSFTGQGGQTSTS